MSSIDSDSVENINDSLSTISYPSNDGGNENENENENQVDISRNRGVGNDSSTSASASASTSTSNSVMNQDEERSEDGESEREREDDYDEDADEDEANIFNVDKQLYLPMVEKMDMNDRNSVQEKRKKRKYKAEWEAIVTGDRKSNATCTNQQNDFQDYDTQTSTHSISSNISYGSSDYNDDNNPVFNFRVLKEQRNACMDRLLTITNDNNNNSSSNQSTSSDGLSAINNNNNETWNKSNSRSELREDLTAQVSARFKIQDEGIEDDVRTSIRRAISKSGLGSVEEGKTDEDNDDKDGGENTDDSNADQSDSDDNDEKGDDEIVKEPRRLKKLKDTIISRRGYIFFVSVCICLLLIGSIVLIIVWAIDKN